MRVLPMVKTIFYWPSYTSTNLNNINISYGHDFQVAEGPENLKFYVNYEFGASANSL